MLLQQLADALHRLRGREPRVGDDAVEEGAARGAAVVDGERLPRLQELAEGADARLLALLEARARLLRVLPPRGDEPLERLLARELVPTARTAPRAPRRRRAAQDRLLERPPHAVSVIEVAPRPGRAAQLGHLAVRQDQDAYFVGEALEHVGPRIALCGSESAILGRRTQGLGEQPSRKGVCAGSVSGPGCVIKAREVAFSGSAAAGLVASALQAASAIMQDQKTRPQAVIATNEDIVKT